MTKFIDKLVSAQEKHGVIKHKEHNKMFRI